MDPLKEVIINNSNLIYSIASKFEGCDMDDLFQVGSIGMIEAYKKFDPSRGVKFTTFAYPYILGRISEYVRENHMVKLSKDMMRAKKKVDRAKAYLSQELMREASLEEISNYLNIPLQNLNMLISYKGDGYSLDEMYFEDLSLYDIIASKNIDYDSLVFLKQEIEGLPEPDRTIMIQRYFRDMTQCDVADNLGLSQVDISRREKKVLVKLRKSFN